MSTSKKWQLFGCLVLAVLGLDQATKLYVHTTFALYESRPVIDNLFAFTYVRNSGAAFGMLARQSETFLRLFFPLQSPSWHWRGCSPILCGYRRSILCGCGDSVLSSVVRSVMASIVSGSARSLISLTSTGTPITGRHSTWLIAAFVLGWDCCYSIRSALPENEGDSA